MLFKKVEPSFNLQNSVIFTLQFSNTKQTGLVRNPFSIMLFSKLEDCYIYASFLNLPITNVPISFVLAGNKKSIFIYF